MANVRRSMLHDKIVTVAKMVGGTAGQVLIGQGASSSPSYKTLSGDVTIDSNGVVSVVAGAVQPTDFSVTGQASTNLAQDDLCYVSSVTAAGVPIMTPADADALGKEATWVCTGTILSGATGTFRKAVLSAANKNTNAGNVGDAVYLTVTGTTTNTWTLTPPSAANASRLRVGRINVKSAAVGQIAWDLTSSELEQIGSNSLQDASIIAGKIAVGGVSAANQFAAGVVDSAALAAAAVSAGKIAVGGVSAANQFAAGVVDSAALAAASVTAGKIGVGGVSASNQFAAGVVDTAAIAALAVDGTKLAAGAVTAGKIGVGGISAANQFAAGVVDSAALAAAAVSAGKIAVGGVSASNQFAAGVVDSAALAAASVSAGKIAVGGVSAANQFAAGVVDSAALAAAAVSAGKIAVGGVSASNQFAAGVVDSAALAAAAVIAGKIAVGGVSASNQFAAGVVDSAALAAAAVTAGKIGVGGISASNQFAAGVVDSAALAAASVTAGKIGVGGISASNQFAAGVVDSTALAANVVSSGQIAQSLIQQSAVVQLTNAQILALRATPITLVAAPGAGKVLCLKSALLYCDSTAAAYTANAGDDLQIKYNNGAGAAASDTVETTGFITTGATNFATARDANSVAAVSNVPLVLHNIGGAEFGGGNAANLMKVVVTYQVIQLP